MPIAHQVQPLSDILRYFNLNYNRTSRANGFHYYRIKDDSQAKKMISLKFSNELWSTLRLHYKYNGRYDEIIYTPILNEVRITTSQAVMGSMITKELTYPMVYTEEEFFQTSLVHDMKDSTLEDFRTIQKLYETYYERSYEYEQAKAV